MPMMSIINDLYTIGYFSVSLDFRDEQYCVWRCDMFQSAWPTLEIAIQVANDSNTLEEVL